MNQICDKNKLEAYTKIVQYHQDNGDFVNMVTELNQFYLFRY